MEKSRRLVSRSTSSSQELIVTAQRMMRVVSYAEAMQLVPPLTEPGVSVEEFESAIAALAEHGLVRRISYSSLSKNDVLEQASARAVAAIQDSPVPDVEWGIYGLLGERLADLVGVSASSMTRYRKRERTTPDDVAERLHVLAQVVTDLIGSYNAYGIRRWFDRSRSALDGLSPAEVLHGQWDPDSPEVLRVRDLAASLVA